MPATAKPFSVASTRSPTRQYRWRVVGACALILAVGAGCKKPLPTETVHTGAPPVGPAVGPVDASAPVPWDGGFGSNEVFTKAGFLAEMSACTVGRVGDFLSKSVRLRDAIAALGPVPAGADAGAESGLEADAKAAWRDAFSSFQELEVFRFGPAAAPPAAGAMGLRDEMYAWPLVSRCRMDETLVDKSYETLAFSSSLVNGRGLAAVDYLLYDTGTSNGCSEFSVINGSGSWAALTASDLKERRRRYAAAAAADVASRAGELARAWAPGGGNFQQAFAAAGTGSVVFLKESDALNALTDALIYIDDEVKDWKLGKPLGYFECTTGTCPGAVEALYSRQSTAGVQSNLKAARRIVQGCGEDYAGLGLHDWLRSLPAEDLANRLLGALVAAQMAVDTLGSSPIDELLAREPAKVALAHANVRAFAALFKGEVLAALTLQLPASAQGDND